MKKVPDNKTKKKLMRNGKKELLLKDITSTKVKRRLCVKKDKYTLCKNVKDAE